MDSIKRYDFICWLSCYDIIFHIFQCAWNYIINTITGVLLDKFVCSIIELGNQRKIDGMVEFK